MDTQKSKNSKDQSATATIPAGKMTTPAKGALPTAVSGRVPPLFRKIDWLALAFAFAAVWVVYFLTLAPELTLQDSGELCTGAFYAGIPHPPGYPFWSIYAWVWTVLLPGNVAWRVEVGEATAAAMACGLVAIMVSRGSSMLMEGIEDLKNLDRKWENAICLVSGIVAGLLLGFGGVMWSESVAINRISLFGVPWVMMVLVCLMRWIYAPHQLRYLFLAMFFFGICATIHQTLVVAAMGIEAAIAVSRPRLGRYFCLGNSIMFLMGLVIVVAKAAPFLGKGTVLTIFCLVGVVSMAAYCLLAALTKETFDEFCLDGAAAAFCLLFTFAAFHGAFFLVLALGALGAFVWLAVKTWKIGWEWLVVIGCGALWILGAGFYLYEPLAGMTNPPMQWGYPRELGGFLHALGRGQYEQPNPTDIFGNPGHAIMQLGMLIRDVAGEFNWVLVCLALVPLVFFFKMRKREQSWIVGLTGIYLCIGVLLIFLMNPSLEKASADLHKVFFTSSHGVIAVMVGYGLALIAAYMATHYREFRQWGLLGGALAAVVALFSLWDATRKYYFGPAGTLSMGELPRWISYAFGSGHGGLPIYGNLILVAIPFAFILALVAYKNRAPLAITLALFAIMPLYSVLSHWGESEQRNHWFGYWFGHDMFTPPFVAPDGKLSYDAKLREEAMKGTNSGMVYPEMARDAILFGGTDPGRFCPTYMIFCDSFIPHKDQPEQDQHFDRRDVYIITQNALADGTYLEYIRAHYNRSKQIDTPFFQDVFREVIGGTNEIQQNYTTNAIARLAYQTLDQPFTALGAKIEARRRKEGVYPREEIYIPSPDDSANCFNEYMTDVQRRYEHDHDPRFQNEPKQVKQGEEPHIEGGRISISGQTSVMSINGLLTKVIFDHNPKNEFYVEESFPLDWMYPYLSPFGIIMKINRQPVEELSDEAVKRDHEFWSRYSERLLGNWITYDTTVKEITNFVQKVYMERDFNGFKGDRRFIRDEEAQKSFSKLRGSIASSIYDWRFQHAKSAADKQRMMKEADFAYRQAFAMCPFSPEAAYRYVIFLVNTGRIEDALMVGETWLELDPYNPGADNLVKQLTNMKNAGPAAVAPVAPSAEQLQASVDELEKQFKANPTNFQAGAELAAAYMQMQRNDKVMQILDGIVANPKASADVLLFSAQGYAKLGNLAKLETALERVAQEAPDSPEAWYNLAAVKVVVGKTPEALKALKLAMDENAKRLARDPKAKNLQVDARTDHRFKALQGMPEFQQMTK